MIKEAHAKSLPRKYTDKEGNEKYITEVVAFSLDRLEVEV